MYEADRRACLECGGTMQVNSSSERSQADVIERRLRYRGPWEGPVRTRASVPPPPRCRRRAAHARNELQPRLESEFLASERRAAPSRERQLVLDPAWLASVAVRPLRMRRGIRS